MSFLRSSLMMLALVNAFSVSYAYSYQGGNSGGRPSVNSHCHCPNCHCEDCHCCEGSDCCCSDGTCSRG